MHLPIRDGVNSHHPYSKLSGAPKKYRSEAPPSEDTFWGKAPSLIGKFEDFRLSRRGDWARSVGRILSDSAAGVFRGGRVISFSMFGGLVTGIMADAVRAAAGEEFVTELRLRVGRPLIVRTAAEWRVCRRGSSTR